MTANGGSSRELVSQLFDAINVGDFDRVEALAGDEFVGYVPISPEPLRGPEGLRRFIEGLRAAFPDLKVHVDEMVAEQGMVVSWLTARGTHRGEFAGLPATGKSAEWTVIHFNRVRDGAIVEDRVHVDQLSLLRQLGVVA